MDTYKCLQSAFTKTKQAERHLRKSANRSVLEAQSSSAQNGVQTDLVQNVADGLRQPLALNVTEVGVTGVRSRSVKRCAARVAAKSRSIAHGKPNGLGLCAGYFGVVCCKPYRTLPVCPIWAVSYGPTVDHTHQRLMTWQVNTKPHSTLTCRWVVCVLE